MICMSSSVISHAITWGTEFTGSSWKMDGEDFVTSAKSWANYMNTYENGASAKVTQYKLGGQAIIFAEGESRLRFGVSMGYGVMPTVSYDYTSPPDWTYNFENKTTYIPFDLYLKYKHDNSKLSFFAGGGADYIMANTKLNTEGTDGDKEHGTFTQKKFVPHIQTGGEWFILKRLSLNMGVKYIFSAVLDNLKGSITDSVGTQKGKLIMDDDGEGYCVF